MLSWNTLRTFCAVLLLLPIVHLAYLLSSEALATLDPSPTVWQSEMDAYIRSDRLQPLPEKPIVVVGGLRVRLWKGLDDLLTPYPVLMRGLGDATVDDIAHYYKRLIGFYRPRAVVLLPSNSEFHVRDAKSANELVDGIKSLINLDKDHGTTHRFYIFTPLKTTLFPQDNEKIEKASQLLQAWAAKLPSVTILDANRFLTHGNGSAKPDYFRGDGINLNESGYLRLAMLLQRQLEQDFGPASASQVPLLYSLQDPNSSSQ